MPDRPHPNEDLRERESLAPEAPGFVVDLLRCIGCHACSVACKTAHDVPLGEFHMRVRWLPRPEGDRYAFLPVFSESRCGDDPASLEAGLAPACVRACPTDALRFGDTADASSEVATLARAHELESLDGPEAEDLKRNVRYRGLEAWMGRAMHRGVALDPRDEDPIYEQR